MTRFDRRQALAAALAGTLGIAGAALAAGGDDAPFTCEIRQSERFGMTALEAVVHADRALSGSYRFVVQGGGTNIRQGGDFAAGRGETATLGMVTVGKGARLDASLTVDAGGVSASCGSV